MFFSWSNIFLHRLSDASGKMKMTKEKTGSISKKDFDSKVIFFKSYNSSSKTCWECSVCSIMSLWYFVKQLSHWGSTIASCIWQSYFFRFKTTYLGTYIWTYDSFVISQPCAQWVNDTLRWTIVAAFILFCFRLCCHFVMCIYSWLKDACI